MKTDKTFKRNGGFSLIEMLVSVLIIATIASLASANYRTASRKANLDRAAHKLASDLRLVQGYALGANKDSGGNVPAGGWGIFIENTNPRDTYYKIYTYDASYGQSASVKQVDFEPSIPSGGAKRIKINSIEFTRANGTKLPRQTIDIIFEPPDPKVHLNANGGFLFSNGRKVIITLWDDGANAGRKVIVNNFGLIDVQ